MSDIEKTRLLIVEDADSTRALYTACFTEKGFSVIGAAGLRDARAIMSSYRPDVVLLDLGLDDGDGSELIKDCRNVGISCIVVSARETVDERIKNLELGADDYVVKPVNLIELFYRIRNMAYTRRLGGVTLKNPIINLNGVQIDPIKRMIVGKNNQESSPLTEAEFTLLIEFAERPNIIFDKNKLCRRVLGHGYLSSSRALDVLVSRLRGKINQVIPNATINSVRGVGYILNLENETAE